VISTDLFQAAFFSVVFLVCFGFVLLFEPSISHMQMPDFEQLKAVSSQWCGWLCMPLLFMMIEQDMGQRCFAGTSPSTVSKASLCAGICTLMVCIVPVFFGSWAHDIGLEVPQGASVLMTAIAKVTAPWMTALVGCAILAAIISTATSLINAISSNLSNDFDLSLGRYVKPLRKIQGLTCLISLSAIFFAFYFQNIVDLLIQSYELSVSCLFIPIWMALFKKKGSFMAALLSVIFGGIGFFLFRIYPLPFPREIASPLLSLLGYGFGELLLSRKLSKDAKEEL
jgi:SSS family solute:Na+ symporter